VPFCQRVRTIYTLFCGCQKNSNAAGNPDTKRTTTVVALASGLELIKLAA